MDSITLQPESSTPAAPSAVLDSIRLIGSKIDQLKAEKEGETLSVKRSLY